MSCTTGPRLRNQHCLMNNADETLFRTVASECGVSAEDVRKAVHSFFDIIRREADALPFDTERKIFSKEVFDSLAHVNQIPFIGRIGPVYSRYLSWRANESSAHDMVKRKHDPMKLTESDIEEIASSFLSGKSFSLDTIKERRKKEGKYNRVWLVGKNGKQLARQIIVKHK